MKDLKKLVRQNVWNLQPYSSARDEFHGEASVFLDANENPWSPSYNRYPDPMQWRLKDRLSELKQVSRDRIFLGNGSDEAIDLVIRTFCEPGLDVVVAISPSYGMYTVSADVNNVECRKVLLNDRFDLEADKVLAAADAWTKVIFLCSPNNPSGNSLNRDEIHKILDCFQGIVVIDEAYIDFSSSPSFLAELDKYPNLIVLQTLSKAWGAAGIRLGMAFASKEIVALLNKVKYPYNVNELTQEKALEILAQEETMKAQVDKILAERARLEQVFRKRPFSFQVYPSDANFLLVKVDYANGMYNALIKQGVVVRNRNSVQLCEECLRITIGTPTENEMLLNAMKNALL